MERTKSIANLTEPLHSQKFASEMIIDSSITRDQILHKPIIEELLKEEWPDLVINMCFVLSTTATAFYLGRLGNINSYASICFGLNFFQLLSLCFSKSFNKGIIKSITNHLEHEEYRNAALSFYRGLTVFLAYNVGLYFLFDMSAFVFVFFGINNYIARASEKFLSQMYGAVFTSLIFEAMKALFRALNLPKIIAYSQIATCICHWISCGIFMFTLDLQEHGLIISISLGYTIGSLIMIIYGLYYKPGGDELWIQPSYDVFEEIFGYTWMMIEEGLLPYFELIVPKLILFLAIYTTNLEYSAIYPMVNLQDIFMILPLGILTPLTNAIDRAYKTRQLGKIQDVLRAALKIGGMLCGGTVVFYLFFHYLLIALYTYNDYVYSKISHLSFFWALSYPAQYVELVIKETFKKIGKEEIARRFYFESYYMICFPACMVLGIIFDWGIIGIWLGWLAAMYYNCAMLCLKLKSYNWTADLHNFNKAWYEEDALIRSL